MPELPEVETIRRGIERHLVGREILSLTRTNPRAARRDNYPLRLEFPKGTRVAEVARRGKFMWIVLHDGVAPLPDALTIHLGMSGQLLIDTPTPHPSLRAGELSAGIEAQKPTKATKTSPARERGSGEGRHLAAVGEFSDGVTLRFVDQRTFGFLALARLSADVSGQPAGTGTTHALIPALAAHIARDPLDEHLNRAEVLARMGATSSAIKRVLLDQGYVSGVGNIYADEALWRVGVHPLTAASAIGESRLAELLDAAAAVMREAVEVGGTSFDALYVDADGQAGYFERELAAYGRSGEPCGRCGTPIEKSVVAGRGSHWCPRCQRLG